MTADLESRDAYGATLDRMRDGHEGVVKILLERGDVNPNKPGNLGNTALSWGAQNGHEGVVKMLLGRGDVNSDKLDIDVKTPP